jgi:hypothetical protein
MPILEIRILPPFAIGRFGSSPHPLEAYELDLPADEPLGFRRITPKETLEIDPVSGAVSGIAKPERIRFKDPDGRIRPVAPFLELFARTSEDTLEPLTLKLLHAEGLGPEAIEWTVETANLKIFRRTGKDADKVVAKVGPFADHRSYELNGECRNFRDQKSIHFGTVRYIKPTDDYPEIRFRFTPAAGLVYGSSTRRFDPVKKQLCKDPVFDGHEERIVYDPEKGDWRGFQDAMNSPTLTNPSDIYQGYNENGTNPSAISWGYLDDVCDGPVSVEFKRKDGSSLRGRCWISSGMPAFAPDSLPIRTVIDELEQAILGPEVDDGLVSIDEAAEIVRRAFETVRLMNTRVMNGNTVEGRVNIAHTLVTQDSNDFGRQYEPTMAPSLVDNLAVRTLHERVYAALKAGSAPWFASALRRPEEIGDLSDAGRRKMPAMLRGADGRALALTRRQISKIVKAATSGMF